LGFQNKLAKLWIERINNTIAMMKYNKLGKSDLNISRIGFGCMSLEDNQEENNKIIDQAVEYGINYFDTADLYDKGMNEESVGKALKGKREKGNHCNKSR
jgi:aryl-alcohol dehydrogenase-like predicted oxidoreductase